MTEVPPLIQIADAVADRDGWGMEWWARPTGEYGLRLVLPTMEAGRYVFGLARLLGLGRGAHLLPHYDSATDMAPRGAQVVLSLPRSVLAAVVPALQEHAAGRFALPAARPALGP